MEILIRRAQTSDAHDIAYLAAQFDYPTTEHEMESRLAKLQSENRTDILVAELHGKVIGWITGRIEAELTGDPYYLIAGFVVDEAHQGSGVGTKLITAILEIGRASGHRKARLRMNEKRTKTHRFYLNRGFVEKKRQVVFDYQFDKE